MVITRSAFESIERTFPIASRLVLENLKRRSEAQVGQKGTHLSVIMTLSTCSCLMQLSW
jgi:hypothetical protein